MSESNENTALVPLTAGPPMNIEVTAENADEMGQCQEALIHWCVMKVANMRHQFDELTESFKLAVKRKWKSEVLKRHAALAEKRVNFYERVLIALKEGYQIIPDLPATVFAIRTDRKKPATLYRYHRERHSDSPPFADKEQEPKALPAGEGEYKNPLPTVLCDYKGKDSEDRDVHCWATWADRWKDIEFPIQMAKPKIMKAATRAMALKIFDELGIFPEDKKKDPIIIARMKVPSNYRFNNRYVSFVVAWHLNTRDL
jgi:hypothetical protein